MVAGCGNKTVKFLVFIFNFLIFVGGAVILGVSLWAALDKNFANELPTKLREALKAVDPNSDFSVKSYTVSLYVLAGVGAFLMLVGFLGCCGAACENRCLLGLFFIIVLILTVIQLAAVIAAFALKGKFYDYLEKQLKKVWEDPKGKEALHGLETTFKCCGVNDGDTDPFCIEDGRHYTKGCLGVIWGEVKKNMVVAAVIGIVVVVIEVLAMIFACVLCSAYSRRDGYYA